MALERVADEQDHVRTDRACRCEDTRQACGPVTAMKSRGILVIHVQVRTVDDDNVLSTHRYPTASSFNPAAMRPCFCLVHALGMYRHRPGQPRSIPAVACGHCNGSVRRGYQAMSSVEDYRNNAEDCLR